MDLIEQHDILLAENPEKAEEHDSANCPICKTQETLEEPDERGEMEKSYTQAEFDAAALAVEVPLKEEISSLKAELDSLKEAEQADAVEAKIQTIRDEAAAEIEALKAQLDEATLRADAAELSKTELVSYLEAEAAAVAEAAAIEARKAERAEALRAETSFTEDYIASRLDDFASMSNEAFEARLEDFKALSTKSAETVVETASETVVRNVRPETASKESVLGRASKIFGEAKAEKIDLIGFNK